MINYQLQMLYLVLNIIYLYLYDITIHYNNLTQILHCEYNQNAIAIDCSTDGSVLHICVAGHISWARLLSNDEAFDVMILEGSVHTSVDKMPTLNALSLLCHNRLFKKT